MTNVNYDQIAEKYDDVREAEIELISLFLQEVQLDKDSKILDFGCGTGNYADKMQRLTESRVFGVDPSEAMLEKAEQKNANITFKHGNHEQVPFPEAYFDFIYMTDVIHHVPDIAKLFTELQQVLKKSGKICIATESHEQIENRFIVDYFPAAAEADKQRYPTIEEIICSAHKSGLQHLKTQMLGKEVVEVDAGFLELVQNKGYSMLQMISEEEYKAGLEKVKADVEKGEVTKVNSGATLVWLTKN